jgi:hypothetical protein
MRRACVISEFDNLPRENAELHPRQPDQQQHNQRRQIEPAEIWQETSDRAIDRLGQAIEDVKDAADDMICSGKHTEREQPTHRHRCEDDPPVDAEYLDETDWLTYEFPDYTGPSSHRLAKFRGQRQKWFALRFTGRDDEIDPLQSRNGQPAEFDSWRWERLERVADLVVPFRRDVYRAVAQRFAKYAG